MCTTFSGGRPCERGQINSMRRWIGGMPYCHKCLHDFGDFGRQCLARENLRDRTARQNGHATQPPPGAPALRDALWWITEREAAERNYKVVRDYGCSHRPWVENAVLETNRRFPCLCAQTHRFGGVAVCDASWFENTEEMRANYETLPPSSPSFAWKDSPCLAGVEVEADCLRSVITKLWKYYRGDTGEHAENPTFIGHICTAKTARLIAESGHVKAQSGKTHRTVACFFVDFRCLTSILKGIRSLWKHLKREGDNARWGFWVQKYNVDYSLEENALYLGSVFGAHFVWASKVDVPIQNFEYHVCPPHLPYGAFVKSQFWGNQAAQWAALTAHETLTKGMAERIVSYGDLASSSFFGGIRNYSDSTKAIIPHVGDAGRVVVARASTRSQGEVGRQSVKIRKVLAKFLELGDMFSEIQESISHQSEMAAALAEDVKMLLGSRPGSDFGWGTGRRVVESPLFARLRRGLRVRDPDNELARGEVAGRGWQRNG